MQKVTEADKLAFAEDIFYGRIQDFKERLQSVSTSVDQEAVDMARSLFDLADGQSHNAFENETICDAVSNVVNKCIVPKLGHGDEKMHGEFNLLEQAAYYRSVLFVEAIVNHERQQEDHPNRGCYAGLHVDNALAIAVNRENIETVEFLVRTFPESVTNSVVAWEIILNTMGHLNYAPRLRAAANAGDHAMVRQLLAAGAQHHYYDGCEFPLHLIAAASADIASIVDDFVTDANINLLDGNEDTLLHHAVRAGNLHTVRVLLAQPGVRFNIVNKLGETALELAKQSENEEIIKAFHHIGADIEVETRAPNLLDVIYRNNGAKYENVTFQGGGPKGLAYLGALRKAIERNLVNFDDHGVKNIAGTSAGAITATVVALVGNNLDVAERITKETDFKTFLDFYRKSGAAIKEQLDGMANASYWGMIKTGLWNIRGIWKAKGTLDEHLGMCKGDAFLAWMQTTIGEQLLAKADTDQLVAAVIAKYESTISRDLAENTELTRAHALGRYITFKDFKDCGLPNLVLVGANASKECSEEFSAEKTPNCPVARAVRISMSIPVLFSPAHKYDVQFDARTSTYSEVQDGPDKYVDGGILRNNPVSVFDKHGYNGKTLGFALRNSTEREHLEFGHDKQGDHENKGIFSFLNTLLSGATFGQQDDSLAKNPLERYRQVIIDYQDVGTAEFDLSAERQQMLVDEGEKATDRFIDRMPRKEEHHLEPRTLKRLYKLGIIAPKRQVGLPRYVFENKKISPVQVLKLYAQAKSEELPALKSIVNPNMVDPISGLAAIHLARAYGMDHVAEKLLQCNANPAKKIADTELTAHSDQIELRAHVDKYAVVIKVPQYFIDKPKLVGASKGQRLMWALESNERHVNELQDVVSGFANQLKERTKENEYYEQNLVPQLQLQVEDLSEKLQAAEHQYQQAYAGLKRKLFGAQKAVVADLEQQLDQKNHELADLRADLKKLNGDHVITKRTLKGRENALEAQGQAHVEAIAKLSAEIKAKQAEIADIRERQQQQVAQFQTELAQLERRVLSLTQENQIIPELQAKVAQLERHLSQKDAELVRVNAAIKAELNQKQQAVVVELERQLKLKKDKADHYEQQYDAVVLKNCTLQQELTAQQQANVAQSDEIARMQAVIDQQQAQLNALKSERETEARNSMSAEPTIEQLKARLALKQAQVIELEAQREQDQKVKDHLQDQHGKLQARAIESETVAKLVKGLAAQLRDEVNQLSVYSEAYCKHSKAKWSFWHGRRGRARARKHAAQWQESQHDLIQRVFEQQLDRLQCDGKELSKNDVLGAYHVAVTELYSQAKSAYSSKYVKRSGWHGHSYRNYLLTYLKQLKQHMTDLNQGEESEFAIKKHSEIDSALIEKESRKSFAGTL